MANSVHLRKLCEGPAAWNAWREANPTVMPDLANASLSLSQRQFGPSNGGPINLRGVNFEGSMLRFATLTDADLEGARLVGTDLMHARLDRANLRSADLTDAMLDHTDLTGTKFDGATLVGATMQNARNLRQPQVDSAHGDASTLLPLGLIAPQRWFPAASPEEFLGCPIPEEVLEEEEDNNPYRLLGVKPNADPAEIREAYRKLVKQLHPDLNPGNRDAEKKFRKVNEAYSLLKNGPAAVEDAPGQTPVGEKFSPMRGRFEVAALFALFLAIGGGVFYWLETKPEGSQMASLQVETPKSPSQPLKTVAEAIPPAASETNGNATAAQQIPDAEPVAVTQALAPTETPQAPVEAQTQAQAQTEPPAASEPRVLAQNAPQPQQPEKLAVTEAPARIEQPSPAIASPAARTEKTTPPAAKAGSQLLSAHAEPDHLNMSALGNGAVSPATPAPVKVAALEDEWQRLRDTQDFAALYGYVRRHPGEPSATEARARFLTLIASLDTTAELAGFVKKNEGQDNPELTAARQRLAKLVEDDALKVETAAWESTVKKNTRDAYEGYLRVYRNGPHAAQAGEKVAAIREAYRQRDETAWAKASLENTRDAYAAYLAAHPRGYHVKDAQKKVSANAATPQARPAVKPKPTTTPISTDPN